MKLVYNMTMQQKGKAKLAKGIAYNDTIVKGKAKLAKGIAHNDTIVKTIGYAAQMFYSHSKA